MQGGRPKRGEMQGSRPGGRPQLAM